MLGRVLYVDNREEFIEPKNGTDFTLEELQILLPTTTCITLESDRQMRRLGECLLDLYRTDGREVTIEPNK